MKPELIVTITACGQQGSGKTRAVDKMIEALRDDFEITAQFPLRQLSNVETYTFKGRLRS